MENIKTFMSFSLGTEEYAIPLLKVKEVLALTQIIPVPHTPNYFKGIMNLRGKVISVIDLRLKFKMSIFKIVPMLKRRSQETSLRV